MNPYNQPMSGKPGIERENLSLFDSDDNGPTNDLANHVAEEQCIDTQMLEEDQPTTPTEEMLASHHPEARQLFDLAIQIMKLQPWGWMEETDLIGIESPDTGEIGFISVMGSIGQYEAVALYLGAQGLHALLEMNEDPKADPVTLLQVRHIQVAFSDRQDLEEEDLK